MSSIASRLEKLERKQPTRKVPSDDSALGTWAIESLFPSTPQTESTLVDGDLSPYTIFLHLVKSGELAAEAKRRGLPLPPEDEPAWKEWTESQMNEGKWSDSIQISPRLCRGSIGND